MLVSHSRRLLFIHVPKTGGMSMRGALKQVCDDLEDVSKFRHHPLEAVLRAHPELEDYFIAGFVRNPWDRLVSWWAMVEAASNRPEGHPHREFLQRPIWQHIDQYPSFESFVLDLKNGPPRLHRPQIEYLSTKGREADFIGRTEEMERDVARLLEKIGAWAVDVPRWNTSPRPASYRELYTDKSAAVVERLFAPDIEAFGYRF